MSDTQIVTPNHTNEEVMRKSVVDEDAEDQQLDKSHTGGEADQTRHEEGLE